MQCTVTLTEVQRIPTSGARAVEPVHVGGRELLAVPQLARDIPGASPGMNGGDSDTDLLLLNRAGGRLDPWATLPAPGGEDAEFFTIGDRAFLAVASIRTGAGPYQFAATSTIFEWRADRFAAFQEVPTFAAKQWRHWQIGGRHFLGLAQGVVVPPGHAGPDQGANRDSVVYEWDGAQFAEFQRIPSQWAYNWHAFAAGGEYFVAHAEHAGPSVLYRWDGTRLAPQQTLAAIVRPRVRHLRRRRRELPRRRLHRRPDPAAALGRHAVRGGSGARRPGREGTGGNPVRRAERCLSGSTSSSAPPPTLSRPSTPRSTNGTAARCTRSPRSRPAAAPTSRSWATVTATATATAVPNRSSSS